MQAKLDATPQDQGPRVCVCMKVHARTLRRAFRAGARSVEELSQATRAGTGCGTCRMDLLELLRQWEGEDR